MHIEIHVTKTVEVEFLEVSAGVRYWEDASVDGVEDTDGTLMPLRKGDTWAPIIELGSGIVKNWPAGLTANIHYKVCDQGEYWLLDGDGKRVAKYASDYVPGLLCPLENGYGDYIILKINGEGHISGWRASITEDEWVGEDS